MKNTKKVALVLEGGGMRGAYTAGCLTWLLNEGLKFDNHYGISTGALNLCSFLKEDKEMLHDISTKYIYDPSAIGVKSLFREGRLVSYDYLFDNVLMQQLKYDFNQVINCGKKAKIGVYDLALSKNVYKNIEDMNVTLLKAACSLPVIGKIVKYDGKEYLDGGITEMIPIKESVSDGNDGHIVITTKPVGYVRKPSSKFVVWLCKILYPQCPQIYKDYDYRHHNYYDQINLIEKLEKEKKAVYMCPSDPSIKVSRLKGDPEKLQALFDLGIKDMENRREDIYNLFK